MGLYFSRMGFLADLYFGTTLAAFNTLGKVPFLAITSQDILGFQIHSDSFLVFVQSFHLGQVFHGF